MNTVHRLSAISASAAACLVIFMYAVTAISATTADSEGHACHDRPCIEIADRIFNAGTIIEGSVIRHDFTVRNKGGRSLKILEVRPGCGCTDVRFDKIIMPVSKGTIHVVFNSLNETGKQIKTIKISCNDRQNPAIQLKIIANVLDAVMLRPVDRIFFSAETGHGLKKTIEISRPDGKPLMLGPEKNMMPEEIKFVLKKKKNSYIAVFSINAEKPGIFRGRIILRTNLWQRPYIAIPVFARVYVHGKKYQ